MSPCADDLLFIAFAPVAREAALTGTGGIIHFEIMPKNINKVVDATVPILGDVITNLAALLPLIDTKPSASTAREQWNEKIQVWKKKYPFFYEKSKKGERMKPQEVIEELDRQVNTKKEDVIISTGVGQHQMWAAQHYRWRSPRTMVTSGGLGVSVPKRYI
jgi:acetolactate synthase-1/2/3 large subunit